MAVALGLGFPVGFFQATRSHDPKESGLSAGGEDPVGGVVQSNGWLGSVRHCMGLSCLTFVAFG